MMILLIVIIETIVTIYKLNLNNIEYLKKKRKNFTTSTIKLKKNTNTTKIKNRKIKSDNKIIINNKNTSMNLKAKKQDNDIDINSGYEKLDKITNKKDKNPKIWELITNYSNYNNYLKCDDEHFPLPSAPQDNFEGLDPYQMFKLYFTEELFEHIFNSTNYHRTHFNKTNYCRLYNITKKEMKRETPRNKEIEFEEIKVFLGILLFMAFSRHSNYLSKFDFLKVQKI